jgi:signal transduction histidine kinase
MIETRAKLLLVDDRPENLSSMEALLRQTGAEIHQAKSGREALELALVHDYALVILDVQMPEMDGFEVAELLRGRPRCGGIPIMFVTAAPSTRARLGRGYGAGAVDFLFKPVDPEILRAKVEVFLQLHRQRVELAQRVEERDHLVEELRETLRLNETFAAVLGHDLRSPLFAIINSAEIILRSPDPERTRRSASRIVGSGQRMARMIGQLLDFARARLAEGIPIEPADVDLGEVSRRVIGEVQLQANRPIEACVEGDAHAQVDPDRMAQVISNLAANAVQHGDAQHPVTVRVDGRDPDRLTLSVVNRGCIPADVLERIFEPFRAGRQGASSSGLGLGLYIVRQIVEAHHGRIGVASSPDQGTTFTVELPRRSVKAVAEVRSACAP